MTEYPHVNEDQVDVLRAANMVTPTEEQRDELSKYFQRISTRTAGEFSEIEGALEGVDLAAATIAIGSSAFSELLDVESAEEEVLSRREIALWASIRAMHDIIVQLSGGVQYLAPSEAWITSTYVAAIARAAYILVRQAQDLAAERTLD